MAFFFSLTSSFLLLEFVLNPKLLKREIPENVEPLFYDDLSFAPPFFILADEGTLFK
jgi:hypothetical protein